MELLHTLLSILNGMSPYILLGFLIAGLLYAFVPAKLMGRHLSGNRLSHVIKAAAIGIPLPLCSCGVLPTAVAMRRNGASRAAASSFLVATPQTGVDSISATYALLGPAFAVIRPVAALVTAISAGFLVGRAERGMSSDEQVEFASLQDAEDSSMESTFVGKLRVAFVYGFYHLVRSIGRWLVAGLVVAALIAVFVPQEFFAALGDWPLLAMIAVVVVAVPMYVCATGSIPVAMSLMLKGLSPGTALVLLMAGPAANFASIGIISRTMGRRCAAIYVGSIVVGAMAFGLAIDYLLPRQWFTSAIGSFHSDCHAGFPWFSTMCSVALLMILAVAFILPKFVNSNKSKSSMNQQLKIKGMNCSHCQESVRKGIASMPGVTNVSVDLSKGVASIEGDVELSDVAEIVRRLGFEPVV